jgi:hypothetical protein
MTWISRDYGVFNLSSQILSSMIGNRFSPCVFQTEHGISEPNIADFFDHYELIYDSTEELYELISWNINEKPTYDILMKSIDVANHDIVYPARNIIHNDLNRYDPSFNSPRGKESYNNFVDILLNQKVFISPDVITRKFRLVILK